MKVINNGVPYVNGKLCGWADIVVLIGGVPITGITGAEYSDSQVTEPKYGAGRYPVGLGKGRITCSGKLVLYQEEVQALCAQSPTGRLQDLPLFDVIVQYLPNSGIVVTDKIRNISISENARKWKEGDTGQEVEVPIVPSHIEWGKIG